MEQPQRVYLYGGCDEGTLVDVMTFYGGISSLKNMGEKEFDTALDTLAHDEQKTFSKLFKTTHALEPYAGMKRKGVSDDDGHIMLRYALYVPTITVHTSLEQNKDARYIGTTRSHRLLESMMDAVEHFDYYEHKGTSLQLANYSIKGKSDIGIMGFIGKQVDALKFGTSLDKLMARANLVTFAQNYPSCRSNVSRLMSLAKVKQMTPRNFDIRSDAYLCEIHEKLEEEQILD